MTLLIDNGSGSFGSPAALHAAARAWHHSDAAPDPPAPRPGGSSGFSFPGSSSEYDDFLARLETPSDLVHQQPRSSAPHDSSPQDVSRPPSRRRPASPPQPPRLQAISRYPLFRLPPAPQGRYDVLVPSASPRQDVVAQGTTCPNVPVLVLSSSTSTPSCRPSTSTPAPPAGHSTPWYTCRRRRSVHALRHGPCAQDDHPALPRPAPGRRRPELCQRADPGLHHRRLPLTVRDTVPTTTRTQRPGRPRPPNTQPQSQALDGARRAQAGRPRRHATHRSWPARRLVPRHREARRPPRGPARRRPLRARRGGHGHADWSADGQLDATVDVGGAASGHLHLHGPLLVSVGDVLHVTGQLDGRPVDVTVPSTRRTAPGSAGPPAATRGRSRRRPTP